MTRVSRATSHRGVTAVAQDLPRAAVRKKKPYKIVLEAVTQEKRKLKSSLTYHDQAPPGFGYVPVGHPDITEWCKEQCRQRNLDVHIVSAKPRSKAFFDPEKISSHVHRIGHHFPLEIIELACKKFHYRYSEEHGLRQTRHSPVYGPAYVERGIANYEQRQALHSKPVTDSEHKEHIRGAIREIFPKIPDADLSSIVNHAFEEGTNRVGNAKELSLARRVQLAVVAHIRHTYTEYDNILKRKTGSWLEARQRVEHVSLAKLKEWRDETDEASNELEETFREVIVLDDDDEDSSDEEISSAPETREHSMEIVSSRATARDLQPELVDRMRAHDPYVSRASRRTIVLRPMPTYSPRESHVPSPSHAQFPLQSSSRIDNRVVHHGPAIVRDPIRMQPEPLHPLHGEPLHRTQPDTGHRLTIGYNSARPMISRLNEPAARVAQPQMMRDSAGQLFTVSRSCIVSDVAARGSLPPFGRYLPRQLQPIETDREPSRTTYSHPMDRPQGTPRSPQSDPTLYGPRPSRVSRQPFDQRPHHATQSRHGRPKLTSSSRRASDQDVVLPSVEREPDASVQKRKSFPHPVYDDYPIAAFEEHSAKRMRPAHDMHPRREVTDLTYSQPRPAYSHGRDVYEVARPRAPAEFAYIPMSHRQSPPRDTRGAYREVVMPPSPRAYMPEIDRAHIAYDRRAVPAVDRLAMHGPITHEIQGSPRVINGAINGYYAPH